MMNAVFGSYSDGESLHSSRVIARVSDDGLLHVIGKDFVVSAPARSVRASTRLGRLPYVLRLPQGGVLELAFSPETEALIEKRRHSGRLMRVVRWLETRAATTTILLVLLAASLVALLRSGETWLAQRAAERVPTNVEAEAGLMGYAVLAQIFQPSELDADAQLRLQRAMERLKQAGKFHLTPVLKVVRLGAPNAITLPGGIVIVTDELVRLAANDDELAALIAHELGHSEGRHGLQTVLRDHTALALVSLLTGDRSQVSSFAGTLPLQLLQAGYPTEFETEADAYAVDLLQRAGINPRALVLLQQRLEKNRRATDDAFSYLATHPASAERSDALRKKILGR